MKNGWINVTLDSLADVAAGQAAPQGAEMFGNTGHPFVRAGSLDFLTKGGDESELEHVDESVAVRHRLRLFPADTVLFPKSGMSATKGLIYRLKQPCHVVSHLAALVPGEALAPEYLTRWLEAHPPTALISNSAYPSIRLSQVAGVSIRLPERIEDQRRIAAILDKADAVRRKRRETIRLLDDFLRSVFLNMFGDPVANPKGFPLKKLSEFYACADEGTKCGPFGSALKKCELVESGIPVLNMDNIDLSGRMCLPFRMWIAEEKYQELKSYAVTDGDIVISRAGTVGKMCVVRMDGSPGIISTNLIRLRLAAANLLPIYFVSLMVYCKGRIGRLRTGQDGAFTHMNTQVLDNLEFPYPPVSLQQKFVGIVGQVERRRACLDKAELATVQLFLSLSQRTFKGEL